MSTQIVEEIDKLLEEASVLVLTHMFRMQRVRDLHPREVIAVHEIGEEAWCPTCQAHYPCPTIQALGDPE